MNVTVAESAEYLLTHDGYLIFTHAAPDGDTLGSAFALAYALRQKGKKAMIICPDPIPRRLAFLEDTEGPELLHALPNEDFIPVSVDVASYPMLKGLDGIDEKTVFELSVDHHDVNTLKANRLLVLPEYPAAGQIIAEITACMGIKPDKRLAEWLYTAVSSDSGCFRYSSTLPSTHRLAAELLETGLDFSLINRRIFECKSDGQLALERDAYAHLEKFYGGKLVTVCLSDEILALDYVDDSDVEQINNIPRQLEGAEVSAMIRRRGDEIKVSFRSNNYYDVAALAKSFGGGGHIHAAGCRFRTSVQDAKEKIVAALKDEFDG